MCEEDGLGSSVSLGEQGPQEEREFDSFYERARCGWSARGVRGAWEARSETDAGVSLLGSSVRSLGCARWAESDMHHPPLTAALLPSPCPRACAALLSPGAITSRWLQTTPG